jgi:hypothetical protein
MSVHRLIVVNTIILPPPPARQRRGDADNIGTSRQGRWQGERDERDEQRRGMLLPCDNRIVFESCKERVTERTSCHIVR